MKYDDDYLAYNFMDLADAPPIHRRDFLKTIGGGIIIFFTFGDMLRGQEPRRGRRRGFRPPAPTDFNAFLRIGEDGRVTCLSGKVEMGQGVHTSLPQMLADELSVSIDSVDVVLGDTDRCPWDMGTFGSMTTRFFGPLLRKAAAEARSVLIDLAAQRLSVPKAQLAAKDGAVVDTKSDRRVSYAELAKGKKIERVVEGDIDLSDPKAWKVMGQDRVRADGTDKVTGKAQYAADIRLPNMLYASILRPPSHDSKLESVDTSAAEAVAGVRVVREGDFVAVLHETPDGAERALALVESKFTTPASSLDQDTIFAHLLDKAPGGRPELSAGDVAEGEKLAKQVVEGTYHGGYVAHAPMEPHAAVAQLENGKATVWASTQTPFRARDQVANALDIAPDKVRVIAPFLGGGFGGKSHNGQVVEAARLAKIVERPVQVAWTRAEEFFYDAFQPAAVVKIKSGVNEQGRVVSWDYGVYFAGSRGASPFYAIENQRTLVHGSGWRGNPGSHPFSTGAWRAPGNNTNAFARESHIDRLAAAVGHDPLEFRLKNLDDDLMKKTLRAAAEKFGWTAGKNPSGRGFGIACGIDAGTYVANVAEVEVDRKSGGVQVKRVVSAQAMGHVINPDGARMQMEGCITMGLGYCFTEEIQFQGGAIHDTNFDTYELPRFSWVPTIETVLLEDDRAPQGGGEPAIICMGAVIANAIYDAVGVRLERLPMTEERVLAALTKKG